MTAELPDVLARILATKRREVADASARVPRAELERIVATLPPVRSLAGALRREPGQPVRVLAEIKRASPSAGPIRAGADPVAIACDYASHGAAALSVLTDREYFDGELSFLVSIRAAVSLPLLRKDFLIDPYQVVEARAAGADAILLIAMALDDDALRGLLGLATELGLEALVEVHDATEAARAVGAGATLIGINHRDLRTFTVDTSLTGQIAPGLPAGTIVVAESGIRTAADVVSMGAAGAHAVLVGEALMRQPSPGRALAALRGQGVAPVAIKVCGVTVPDDAAMVAAAGVDYVGLNCWAESRRYVVPERLALLAGAARAVRPELQVVGLFVDAYVDQIEALHALARFDVIQLHGDESIEVCREVRRRTGLRVWKAVPIADAGDVAALRRWLDAADAVVLDAPSAGRGGSGTRIDPALAVAAVHAYPGAHLMLAGGLTPDNVGAAIAEIAPWGVDVASGVELAPRLKDADRVRAFVAAARGAVAAPWSAAAATVSLDP